MLWSKSFRLWQTYSQEYMFVWNCIAAKHTLQQLPPADAQEVRARYHTLLTTETSNPEPDPTLGHSQDLDYYWVSLALADLGILPILGPRSPKWFYVTEPRQARAKAGEQIDSLVPQVLEDLRQSCGVRVDMEPDPAPPMIETVPVRCSTCGQESPLPKGLAGAKTRCPCCGAPQTVSA